MRADAVVKARIPAGVKDRAMDMGKLHAALTLLIVGKPLPDRYNGPPSEGRLVGVP